MLDCSNMIIFVTFFIALLLTVIPLPEWIKPYRPQWVSLVLIYWCIALPHRVGIGTGFSLGILLDTLTSTLLGQHALGMVCIAFLAIQLHMRVRTFPLWQQALGILALLLLEHLCTYVIIDMTSQTPLNYSYWFAPLVGAVLWPWVFVTLRNVRRHFRVV